MTLTISFTRRFSMAHRSGHSKTKKCSIPHGHNELVLADLYYQGKDSLDTTTNMAADFNELKKTWHLWIDNEVDHAIQLFEADPLIEYFRNKEPENLMRVMTFPGDPTSEALAAVFFRKLSAFLEHERFLFAVKRITVEETPTNSVSVEYGGLSLFPWLNEGGWWCRPDMSINDF